MLGRWAYQYKINKKWSVNRRPAGHLHLGKDSYTDSAVSNHPIAISGSEGITLNATGLLRYRISPKITFALSGGVPLIVRDVRPDGLTREFVLSPEISLNF